MSESFTTYGEIIFIGPIEERGQYQVRNFGISQNDGKYDNEICFELFGEKNVGKVDGMKEGQTVEVSFRVKSREWKGKWYTNAQAWMVKDHSLSNPQPQPQSPAEEAATVSTGGLRGQLPNPPDDDPDNLPF